MKLSIVIPCYNEEKNIPLIFERFNACLGARPIEVILVNNGSRDRSQQVLDELLPRYPFARTVLVVKNQGYGFGILSGLDAASGDFLGWTHADLQTDPRDVVRAYDIIQSHDFSPNLYVKGQRKGRSAFDLFFTMGMSFFENFYLQTFLWDINAQPNVFHRSVFERWINPPHDFSLDLYSLYTARKMKLRLIRFPVVFPPRLHGTSSWNTGLKAKWKFIKRTLDFSTKLKKELRHAVYRTSY